MTPAHMLKLERLARALEAAIDDSGLSFAEAVEAMALIAAHKADAERIGTVNEASWTNACSRLFDLSQAGRLYRDLEAA